jgi:hypothetical protein
MRPHREGGTYNSAPNQYVRMTSSKVVHEGNDYHSNSRVTISNRRMYTYHHAEQATKSAAMCAAAVSSGKATTGYW